MTNPHESSAREDTFRQVLCEKLEEGRAFTVQIFTIFTLFVVMNGVLLKIWVDGKGTDQKYLIGIGGLLLAAFAISTSFYPHRVRKSILNDIGNLNERLGRPLVSKQLLFAWFLLVASLCFFVITGGLWIFMLTLM